MHAPHFAGATPESLTFSIDEALRLCRAIKGDDSMVDATALDRLKLFNVQEQLAEAASTARETCAAETGNHTCYVCLDDGESEGLVRGCACRGTSGFAHLSCLVRQAKLATSKNNEKADSTDDGENVEWPHELWDTCGLCEQEHHGVVKCALGWVCWTTYEGLPETCEMRRGAMMTLGNGLLATGRYEDALVAYQCSLVTGRRIIGCKDNLAACYQKRGMADQALRLQREVHAMGLTLGIAEDQAVDAATLAEFLVDARQFAEAKAFGRENTPAIRGNFGADHRAVLDIQTHYGRALFQADDATNDDLVEAETVLDDVLTRARRVFGERHPDTARARDLLAEARRAQSCDGARFAQRCAAYFTKMHSNPLQYCEKNCLLYEQGRMALITRDWQLLGNAKAKEADKAVGARLRFAFAFRRDVVELKNIFLRLFNEGRRLETSLASLESYFFRDDTGGGHRNRVWKTLSDALHELRGSLKVLQDAHDVIKWTCCLPRCREAPRPPRLGNLVKSGCVVRLLKRAARAAPELKFILLEETSVLLEEAMDDDDRVRLEPARAVIDALDATSCTQVEQKYALAVVTARGGVKALSIHEQVRDPAPFTRHRRDTRSSRAGRRLRPDAPKRPGGARTDRGRTRGARRRDQSESLCDRGHGRPLPAVGARPARAQGGGGVPRGGGHAAGGADLLRCGAHK